MELQVIINLSHARQIFVNLWESLYNRKEDTISKLCIHLFYSYLSNVYMYLISISIVFSSFLKKKCCLGSLLNVENSKNSRYFIFHDSPMNEMGDMDWN